MLHNWKEASVFGTKNTETIAHYQMDPQSMSLIGQGRQKQEHTYLCQTSNKKVGCDLITRILDFSSAAERTAMKHCTTHECPSRIKSDLYSKTR